jgi:hypothetical protein
VWEVEGSHQLDFIVKNQVLDRAVRALAE